MKKSYFMGFDDTLLQTPSTKMEPTAISKKLRLNLLIAAIDKALRFYEEFFEKFCEFSDIYELAKSYDVAYDDSKNHLLLGAGGIPKKDHLSLWCLGKVLRPNLYVESGVYMGSSLQAILTSGEISMVIGIDPVLSNLRINPMLTNKVTFISEKDFSQIEFGNMMSPNLVYFDDHINAAKRIIESYNKGFTYIIIDDAPGIEGMCQRLIPSVPTVPLIMHYPLLKEGESIAWSFEVSYKASIKEILKYILSYGKRKRPSKNICKRVNLNITNDLIDLCREAFNVIDKVEKLPDLGEFIHQDVPHKTADTSKFIIKLKTKL